MKQLTQYIQEKLKINSKSKISKYLYKANNCQELVDITIQLIKKTNDKLVDLNDIDVSEIKDLSFFSDKLVDHFTDKRLKELNLDVSKWDVSNCENMEMTFYELESFDCDLSEWKVSKCTNMPSMFMGCKKFTGKGLDKWDISNVEDIDGMFRGCHKFTGKTIENWNVSNCKVFASVFRNCFNFNADLSNWDVSNMVNMNFMFYRSHKFEGKGLSKWNPKNLETMKSAFGVCNEFKENIDNWKDKFTKDIEGIESAFFGIKNKPTWGRK